jgi:hypothetical protein
MGGVDPGYGRPGGIHRPDQGLPGGGHISNRPPGSGSPGIPDNELPSTPPPQLLPGYTLVMVRDQSGKWEYAAIAPGSPPPRPLPSPGRPDRPDNTLPGQGGRPPHVSGGPVPQPPGGTPENPIAPTPEPKR